MPAPFAPTPFGLTLQSQQSPREPREQALEALEEEAGRPIMVVVHVGLREEDTADIASERLAAIQGRDKTISYQTYWRLR